MDKIELRNELKTRLVAMEVEARAEKSKAACRNLIETPQFSQAAVVMIYLSLPHEVDTATAILAAWQQGKTVAVPKISWQQRHMIPVSNYFARSRIFDRSRRPPQSYNRRSDAHRGN